LPQDIRVEARKKMVAHFHEMDKNDSSTVRVRDDHFTAPKEDGTYWVKQLEDTDKIYMLAFAVIVAEPETILRRRITRNIIPLEPNFLNLDTIVLHQELEIQVASFKAKQLQIPIRILNNEDSRVIQTATLLLEFIKEVIGQR
jgi:adenylate kinase